MTLLLPAGDYRTTYRADTTIFPTRGSRLGVIVFIAVLAAAPAVLDKHLLSLLIQIGYLSIAALGLNILVGFTGQISIGHAAFFGFGAFASAYFANAGIPVVLSIPLAGFATTAVGMVFGLPAARLKGLYLAIATLAAQFIIEDFLNRADWFTGGVAGTIAPPFSLLGMTFDTDERYAYVVLVAVILAFVLAANLLRTRDGRALVAVRDHYLSAEMMGINLTKYRTLSFGISAFYAGIGGALYAHYLQFVSVEGFTLLFSIQFLGMIIIGGLGSLLGTLLGTAFMVLLPEVMQAFTDALAGTPIDSALGLRDSLAYLREITIGLAIILFLVFEPDGLAHRWRQIKAYWKLFPFSH
ncbi:branched-chain amino acid ABC transporter permease [Rhodoligotrophos defluvii]|uniref:branched-chain amino acid ABC transporter permease n=1 Tax=Rhodoligotrophos defluvii TaxID=2561934 RepID=UPI0010C96086|nr:branched-chain amino acid ABC transporter permease [Rhodoligotrophos defluvii]